MKSLSVWLLLCSVPALSLALTETHDYGLSACFVGAAGVFAVLHLAEVLGERR